jgi:hypothetical protein
MFLRRLHVSERYCLPFAEPEDPPLMETVLLAMIHHQLLKDPSSCDAVHQLPLSLSCYKF